MLTDKLKRSLREGKPVVGCTIQVNSPELVEACGMLGFDFVFLDAEHAPFSERECQSLVMAADVVGMSSLIRTRENDPRLILRLMDIGATGIVVPEVESKEDVERAIKAVKYLPEGCRGLSATRAASYGLRMSLGEYTKMANANTVVICQIESRAGVENVDAILSSELIDGIIIGTTDLSHSLGVAGQRDSQVVKEAVEHVVSRARAAAKPYGAVVRPGEKPEEYLAEGYQIILGSGMSFFVRSAREFLEGFRAFRR